MKKLTEKQVQRNTVKVIEDAGGRSALAREFDILHWSVNKWYRAGRIPSDRIKQVCRIANDRLGEERWQPCMLLRS